MTVNFFYIRRTICSSKLYIKLEKALIPILILVLINFTGIQNSLAKDPINRPTPDIFGYELEIDSRHLSRIINIFDLEHTKKTFYYLLNKEFSKSDQSPFEKLTLKTESYYQYRILLLLSKYIDTYLYNEDAFWSLPENIRNELSKGLNLNKKDTLVIKENAIIQNRMGPIASANAPNFSQNSQKDDLGTPSSIILDPYSVGIMPKTKNTQEANPQNEGNLIPTDFSRSSSGLYIPQSLQQGGVLVDAHIKNDIERKSEWPVVHMRWKGLPFKEKLKYFNIDYASDILKASLIFEANHENKSIEYAKNILPLANDSTDFMTNMDYHFEGNTGNWYLEIKPEAPLSEKEVLESLRQKFSHLSIPWDRSVSANQNKSDLSLHLHLGFSNPNQINIADENRLIQNYNLLTLIRLLSNPANQNVLQMERSKFFSERQQRSTNFAVNFYHLPITSKGLIRWIDRGHIEVRELTKSADKIIQEISELYRLSENEGKNKIANEIKRTISQYPHILKIIEQNNYIVLFELGELLDDPKYTRTGYDKLNNELNHQNPKSILDVQYIHSSSLFFQLLQSLIQDHKDGSLDLKKAFADVITIYYIKHSSNLDLTDYNIFHKLFLIDFHKFFIWTVFNTDLGNEFKNIILKSCQVKLNWNEQKTLIKKLLNKDYLLKLISNEQFLTTHKLISTKTTIATDNEIKNIQIERKRFELIAGMLALYGDKSNLSWSFYESFNEQLTMLPADIKHLFLLLNDILPLNQNDIDFTVFEKIISIPDDWTVQELNKILKRSLKNRNPVLLQLWNKLFAGEINVQQMKNLYQSSREQKISDLQKMFPFTESKKKSDVYNCNKIYNK